MQNFTYFCTDYLHAGITYISIMRFAFRHKQNYGKTGDKRKEM